MCSNPNNRPLADMIIIAVLSISFFSSGLAIADPVYHSYPSTVTIDPAYSQVILSQGFDAPLNCIDQAARYIKCDIDNSGASAIDRGIPVALGFDRTGVMLTMDFVYNHSFGNTDLTGHSFSDRDFSGRSTGKNADFDMSFSSYKYHLYDGITLISINFNDLFEQNHDHQNNHKKEPDSTRLEDSIGSGLHFFRLQLQFLDYPLFFLQERVLWVDRSVVE
ncbi:MAG: hypothetical protein ACLPX5_16775 [Dissulfurispiraceae bacterium]